MDAFFSFTVKLHCYDNPCKNEGKCHDHSDNYTCECLPGFLGDQCHGKTVMNLLFSDIFTLLSLFSRQFRKILMSWNI